MILTGHPELARGTHAPDQRHARRPAAVAHARRGIDRDARAPGRVPADLAVEGTAASAAEPALVRTVIDGKRRLALPGNPHRVFLCRGAPLLQYRHRGLAANFVAGSVMPIILACPLLIPSANVGLRTLSVLASVDIVFKMVDYFRH